MSNYIINPTFTDPSAIKGLTSAKGDVLSGDAGGGIFTTSVGADGTVLTASSAAAGGLTWSAAGGTVTLTSAGGTETLVNDGTGPTLANKGLTAGTGISLGSTATAVTITNSSPGSSVSLSSAGGTETLVNDGTGPALANKGLTAGTGISLGSTATAVTITNSDTGSAVTLSSAGGTETLVNDGTGPALANKGLTAGTGISLGSDASSVTITNSDTGSAVTLASAGGTTLVSDGVGPALVSKGLITGTAISFSSTASAVTINSTGSNIALTSAGGTETLVNDGTGPDLSVKGITAGTGISLGSTATALTVTNSSPASSVTLADVSVTGDETLVGDGTGPSLTTKKLTAGTGISLSSDANQITVTNDSAGSSVTLSSAGGTETLVNDGTGPALATKGVTAGTGISLGSTATALTVTNSSPASSVTLADVSGTGDETLVGDGTGPSLTVKKLTAGTDIDLSSDANQVTFSTPVRTFEAIVDTAGNGDYTTLGAAISGGASSIFIRNGTYTEGAISLPDETIILGESPGNVIIDFNASANEITCSESATTYSTGTITVTKDDATVTGSGTTWTTNIAAGDWIRIRNDWYEIDSVTDNTNLELVYPFRGTTASGLSYVARTFYTNVSLENLILQNSTATGGLLVLQGIRGLNLKNISVDSGVALGVIMTYCTQTIVENLDAVGFTNFGLTLANCDNITVNNANIRSCGNSTNDGGISIDTSYASVISNSNISGCTKGIEFDSCAYINVLDCIFNSDSVTNVDIDTLSIYIIVKDCYFADVPSTNYAIEMAASNCEISSCKFQSCYGGIHIPDGTLDCVIDKCTMVSCTVAAIEMAGSTSEKLVISNCHIKSCAPGISLAGRSNTVVGCCLENNSAGGIDCTSNASFTTISGCTIREGAGGDGISIAGTQCVVADCTIHQAFNSGIDCSGANNCITGCRINNCNQSDTSKHGIQVDTSNNTSITGCIVSNTTDTTGSDSAGIYVNNSNTSIAGCRVFGCDDGIFLDTSADRTTLHCNNMRGNSGSNFTDNGTNTLPGTVGNHNQI